jgi:ferric-dicitrate binding protein FerR (iron transport regulator)
MDSFCAKHQSCGVLQKKRALILGSAFVVFSLSLMAVGPRAWAEDAITPKQARKAWKDHHLEYLRVPLKIVIPSVNVHSKKPIVLADDGVGNLLFSGTVFDDQVTDWLRALTIALPIVVIEGDDRIVITLRKTADANAAPPK